MLAAPYVLHAQYLWSVSPGAVIPTNNAADTELIVENAPTANFNIDFNTGGAPRLEGTDLENTLSIGFDFSFDRGWGSGGFTFSYEATYRIYLLPTNNPDVWVVAMDYKTKAWGWSRSGTLYLWKVNKNSPTIPISTSASDVATPSSVGTVADVDANENGWLDSFDWDYWAEWESVPDGIVTIGDLRVIDSWEEGDYDGWFENDAAMEEQIEVTADT
ncbi:MAG TPA: hypothetical protein VK477_00230 [Acidobacteriota bacterium]|nr:hypothetical protein [Acidobacteriota bacterium]